MPSGKHAKYAQPEKCSLLYNEYVVYDTARVQICYAAKGMRVCNINFEHEKEPGMNCSILDIETF